MALEDRAMGRTGLEGGSERGLWEPSLSLPWLLGGVGGICTRSSGKRGGWVSRTGLIPQVFSSVWEPEGPGALRSHQKPLCDTGQSWAQLPAGCRLSGAPQRRGLSPSMASKMLVFSTLAFYFWT